RSHEPGGDMRRVMMKSKIHRATVTGANLDYEGSLTIDKDLMDAADILPNEQIHVWDVTNGARLGTYALGGKTGSGTEGVDGAGAGPTPTSRGATTITARWGASGEGAARRHEPLVVFVDGKNKVKDFKDAV